MSFFKIGETKKIEEIAGDDAKFDELRQQIADKNDLVRCSGCSHLLAKRADGVIDIQHKKVVALIKEASALDIQCPICKKINSVNSH